MPCLAFLPRPIWRTHWHHDGYKPLYHRYCCNKSISSWWTSPKCVTWTFLSLFVNQKWYIMVGFEYAFKHCANSNLNSQPSVKGSMPLIMHNFKSYHNLNLLFFPSWNEKISFRELNCLDLVHNLHYCTTTTVKFNRWLFVMYLSFLYPFFWCYYYTIGLIFYNSPNPCDTLHPLLYESRCTCRYVPVCSASIPAMFSLALHAVCSPMIAGTNGLNFFLLALCFVPPLNPRHSHFNACFALGIT